MTRLSLKIAGYVALVNACSAIPLGLACIYYSVGPQSIITKIELSLLTAITMSVAIYLVLTFKKFLKLAFNFHDIDQSVSLIIVVTVLYSINDIIATFLPPNNILNNINVGLITLLGIANIFFAYKLQRLEFDLFNLKKGYCLLTVATGILLASVYLSALSIVPGVFSDLMLGAIFLLASKETIETERIS